MMCWLGEKCFKKSRAEKKRASNQDTQSMDIRLADAQFKDLTRKEGWTQCPYCGYVVCKSVRRFLHHHTHLLTHAL